MVCILYFERDWDDGIPLLLFAVREVTQETLGFSQSELVFVHTVRGPFFYLYFFRVCSLRVRLSFSGMP